MGKDFLRRHYPLTLVENSLIRALRLNREDLLTEKPKNIKNTDDSLFAITTYHPSFNSFRNIITNNWPLLNRSNNTNQPKIADTVQRYTPRAVSLAIIENDHTRAKSDS